MKGGFEVGSTGWGLATRAHIHVRHYKCISICTRVCFDTYGYRGMSLRSMHRHSSAYLCVHVYIHVYIHMYIYTYTYGYTYRYGCMSILYIYGH